ncbi:MAG: ABC transporter [Microgenomates group bacterium GW2011_GWC2_46_7]|nr:MAG: ABC transporter [Microgenomates group bacterium GW2011_GWC2_46_7]
MSIRVTNLSFSYGEKPLLTEVNFRVENGQKVGLVGENGTGKSTLLKLFRSEEYPDEGSIEVEGTMELVPQEVKRDPLLDSAKSVMLYVNPEGTKEVHEIRKLFAGLGIGEIELDSEPQQYSGGVKTKLALARALFKEPDILLLDEPTNFMDHEGKAWVMNLLAQYPKTLILISHDLSLMVEEYKGNYSQYKRLQKEAEELFKKRVEAEAKHIKSMEKGYKKIQGYTSKKGVKVKVKLKHRIAEAKANLPELPPAVRSIKIQLPDPVRSGEILITARKISKSFGSLEVMHDVDFAIRRGERIALLGGNGVGKSTLIKLLIGELTPDSGVVEWNPMNKLGYYSQEFEDFDMDKSVLQLFMDRCERMESFCRPFLGKFNFLANKVHQKVGTLSGGEKTRLAIAMLCSTDANLLILDEPTTYLDVLSQRVILDALKSYKGTMIIVSHTEEFIKELKPDKVFLMPEAKMDFWLEDYGERVGEI